MSIKGRCRCGAVAYKILLDGPLATYACHCINCQTWSGSAFGLHAMLPETALDIDGPIGRYVHVGSQGTTFDDRACSVCHTRLYNTNASAQGYLFLRAGTLDDSASLRPFLHIWTRQMQPWLELPPGVPRFDESPTPDQYAQALAAHEASCR
jgi:hypothetical protein